MLAADQVDTEQRKGAVADVVQQKLEMKFVLDDGVIHAAKDRGAEHTHRKQGDQQIDSLLCLFRQDQQNGHHAKHKRADIRGR